MGQALQEKKYYSIEEYFELEEQTEIRHEFYHHELFAMAGTSTKHNIIVRNTSNALDGIFAERACRVFSESVKVELERNNYYVYPDVILTCNPKDLEAEYVLKYPSLLVEVKSKSTQAYDMGLKWKYYQKLHSLQYYILISQENICVEVYTRQENGFWSYRAYEELNDEISLSKLDAHLVVRDIYKNITFTTTSND